MNSITSSEAAKAIVRRNTEEVQGRGNFDVLDELFADDFIDHTPQPGATPDKAGVRKLYTYLRVAFPDFHAEIHWQLADGDRVTTYKTYCGTHRGPFLGVAPTHRKTHFETVAVMRVHNGKITDHWGVANLLSLMQQVGGWIPPAEVAPEQPSKIDEAARHFVDDRLLGSWLMSSARLTPPCRPVFTHEPAVALLGRRQSKLPVNALTAEVPCAGRQEATARHGPLRAPTG
jgi:steroid delta-isomerase-like uncharacterized protein